MKPSIYGIMITDAPQLQSVNLGADIGLCWRA